MAAEMQQWPKGDLESVKELIGAALQAMTAEMAAELAVKAVKGMELADEVMQPETLSLLRKLPEASASLERTLSDVQRLEANGTLKSLLQLAEMVGSMKNAITGPMISESVEKMVQGAELADTLIQKGAIQWMAGMSGAFERALQEREKSAKPLTLMQMANMMRNEEVREGLGLFLAFVKALPGELKK